MSNAVGPATEQRLAPWVRAAFALAGPSSPFTWERREEPDGTMRMWNHLDVTLAVAINDVAPEFEVTGNEDGEGRWVVLVRHPDGRVEGAITNGPLSL